MGLLYFLMSVAIVVIQLLAAPWIFESDISYNVLVLGGAIWFTLIAIFAWRVANYMTKGAKT